MPFHDEPKPKKKSLPLWVEALDLLQSKSASKLLFPYRQLEERRRRNRRRYPNSAEERRRDDEDFNPSPTNIAWKKYRSYSYVTMRAARTFWLGTLLAELERLYGTKWCGSGVHFSY